MRIRSNPLGRGSRVALVSVSFALLAGCGGGGPQPDADGWLTLFNGTDLSNWSIAGDGNWRVEDGALTAAPVDISADLLEGWPGTLAQPIWDIYGGFGQDNLGEIYLTSIQSGPAPRPHQLTAASELA